jgi:tRNA(fMet)-specific endonuclease VapC
MKLALDTNRYGDFVRGDAKSVEIIHSAAAVFIPFIVLGELRAGFASGNRAGSNETILTRILNSPTVSVLNADQETTLVYAALCQQRRVAGTPIPTNDIWIAALVIQHDLILFTRDKHFEKIPQLARI